MSAVPHEGAAETVRVTERSKVRRFAMREAYERDVVNSILDECLIAYVGFQHEDHPAVLPLAFWRMDDHVYWHGATRNRLMLDMAAGGECCFVVNTLDALVLARAAMHHSVNYRSVMIYGRPQEVTDQATKFEALRRFIERVYPGRWDTIRAPTEREMSAMRVMRLHIDEASAKVHAAPPTSLPHDAGVEAWTGVVPVRLSAGTPIPTESVPPGTPIPEHALNMGRNWDASFFKRFPSEIEANF